MVFSGLQKLTLLDYPGLTACTVFTSGCNFHCPFCHNSSLVLHSGGPEICEEEILAFLKKREGILEGLVISGGEPTLHKDLEDFLIKVKQMSYKVKLDTNGTNPEMVKCLVGSGLVDKVAMDIKNGPSCYPEAAGILKPDMEAITETRDFLLTQTVDYEFRTTVVKGIHTQDSLREAARWIQGAKEYYLQGFVDSGAVLVPDRFAPFTKEEMVSFLDEIRHLVPCAKLRGI